MLPPRARVEVVHDTYFGTTVDDPYRWLEDWQGAEARSWLDAQAAATREYLDGLPDRPALLARIGELSNAAPNLSSFQVAGGRVFYLRRGPGENLAKLVVRLAPQADEHVLVDPNGIGGQVHTAIDWYRPSRDGRRVAYGTSQGGSEESTLAVLEVDSVRRHDLAISRTRFGGVSWLHEHQSFVYHRLAEYTAGTPPTERYSNSRCYLHRLGDDPERDLPVFGSGINPHVAVAPMDWPILAISPASDWMIGLLVHGVQNELTLYAAPLSALDQPAACPWRKLVDVDDAVTNFDFAGDTIYLLTRRNAPRSKVIAATLAEPDLAGATVVVPEGRAVIEEVKVAGDYLLTKDLDGGISRLRRVRRAGGEPEAVLLPVEGTMSDWANEAAGAEVVLQLTSWTFSPRVYRLDTNTGVLEETGWQPPSPVDFSRITAREVQVPAPDGTLVPLSIIHQQGLAHDGDNRTVLTGYGSYGISLRPTFNPTLLAWLERGGVYAVAHLRGSGEYGQEWHEAGRKLTKETTITDFIACAEYLIAQRYARPQRLAGAGGSAGGIPTGGALVRRPELWAAMLIMVGLTNALRFELSENGPPNIPEFGTVTTEAGFRGLQIMDSYASVRDGTPYPVVLLTTGWNDPRVVVWQATKMAARLQAATTSDRPILLRVEYQGGHGMGSTRRQTDEELADRFALLLHVME